MHFLDFLGVSTEMNVGLKFFGVVGNNPLDEF
jgi:hypothetical protein